MKKPNFFIIGAPKCGTTALSVWLSQHPQVFLTYPKEPNFFSTDIKCAYREGWDQYNRYFDDVRPWHLAVGEASTNYLRSKVAVRNILQYVPDAKFVVGLRNPVELAISWHGEMLREAQENESSFETAWRLQELRAAGRRVPSLCDDPSNLIYGEVCRIGTQLARLYDLVERERVFVYTLEDLRSDPRGVWARLLEFLRVEPYDKLAFNVVNPTRKTPRWLAVLGKLAADTKRSVGLGHIRLGLLTALEAHVSRPYRPRVSPEMQRELYQYFRDEIMLLETLLQRDFRAWHEVIERAD